VKRIYVNTADGKHSELTIQGAFVQTYTSAYKVIFRLKYQCSLYLLFWIINEMNEYNQIILNKGNRSEFISSLKQFGKKYSDESVRSSIKDLIDAEAIISLSVDDRRESSYMINPIHFWKTKIQKNRTVVIQAFVNQLKIKDNERNTFRSTGSSVNAVGSGEAK